MRSRSLGALIGVLLFPCLVLAAPPGNNLGWLKGLVGDGALMSYSGGNLHLTELSSGSSVKLTQNAANGWSFEFSVDGSKLAFIEGTTVKGRMRKGDTTLHTIATGVDPLGGVHWVSDTEVVYVKSGQWYRATIDGQTAVKVAALTALGAGGQECDVKLTGKGVWCYVGRTQSGVEVTWKTSDGKTGGTGGTCSSSFSPDVGGGVSVTGLEHDHKSAYLKQVIAGAPTGTIKWSYDYVGDKGFDNHRWSSNHKDFVVVQDEKNSYCTVLQVSTNTATWMGPQGTGEMYGDFTAGTGSGAPWPGGSKCGDGVLDSGETCDPPSSCPQGCDDKNACTKDTLSGDAAKCTAACAYSKITTCAGGDGCCPSGCDSASDSDCSASCGNGTVESGETCDPPSSCPQSCDDDDACTEDLMTGSAANCNVACSHTQIAACAGGDGCCPAGCSANSDSDCSASCGNGTVESGETCDPPSSCPQSCDDGDACTEDSLDGDAASCDAACTSAPITTCKDGDGCCPPGCGAATDSDCSRTGSDAAVAAGDSGASSTDGGVGRDDAGGTRSSMDHRRLDGGCAVGGSGGLMLFPLLLLVLALASSSRSRCSRRTCRR